MLHEDANSHSDFIGTLETMLTKINYKVTICCDCPKLNVNSVDLIYVLTQLRDAPSTKFLQLLDICAVDYPEKNKRFEVIYNLLSIDFNQRLRVSICVNDDINIPSVVDIYSAANWYEREVWDMFGLKFEGHPDLRRLLTDYGFSGYPLRKDFPLFGNVELRYDYEAKRVVYEPVNLTQSLRTFDFESPWEGVDFTNEDILKKNDREKN